METNDFRHHPDGYIFIKDFQCTVEEFLILEPEYKGLPEFFHGREYFQGISHRLYTAKNEIYLDNEGLDWAEGDLYISKVEDYKVQLEALRQEQADNQLISG